MEKRQIRRNLFNRPDDGLDLHLKLVEYFNFYNNQRRHEGIEYQRPVDVYTDTSSDQTAVTHEITLINKRSKKKTLHRNSNLILLIYCLKKGEYYNGSSEQTAVIHEIDTYEQKKKKQKENFTTEVVT